MQFLGHEDDDFLFMNPDIQNEIAAGVRVVSVYATAGQSCGVGEDCYCTLPLQGPICPALGIVDSVPPLVLSREEFAAARQAGIRASYAQMVCSILDICGPAVWTRALIQPDGNYTVELYTLSTYPQVQLIFLDLPDGGDNTVPNDYAISNMFDIPTQLTATIVPFCDPHTNSILANESPSGGPVANCDPQTNSPALPLQVYDRAGIASVLSSLINAYQPIEVRTLDPQPFEYCEDIINLTVTFDYACSGVTITYPNNTEFTDPSVYIVSFDNNDHTAVARYIDEALLNYHGPNGTGRYSVIHYKGYSSPDFPPNLGDADYDRKLATATSYIPFDPNFVNNQGSPEVQTGAGPGYYPFYRRVWERYPASTNWVQRAPDGRLVAVTVEDRQVKIWYEAVAGGPSWIGPVAARATGSPVAPYLTLLKRPDGLLQIFALRLPPQREHFVVDPSAPLQDVITAVQITGSQAGVTPSNPIAFGPWQSLGSPDSELCSGSSNSGTSVPGCVFVGVPAAAVDGAGRMFVFAKNSEGLVSYSYFQGGVWSAWNSTVFSSQIQHGDQPVPQDIIDGIAPITRDDGIVEVFATLRDGNLWHFIQDPGSTHFTWDRVLWNFSAASAPTVTKNQDGRLEIFYREATNFFLGAPGARVRTLYQSNGAWQGPVVLYGDAGAGPVAAMRREGSGQIMVFERNVGSGISETNQVAPNDVFNLQWQILGGFLNEYPAAATDKFGRAVVVVKGIDGNLYSRRELSATSFGSFGPWQLADSSPTLAAKVVGQSQSGTTLSLTLQLTDSSPSDAESVSVNQLILRTLSGSGTVTVAGPVLPANAGNLGAGGSTTLALILNVPSTVSRFSIVENGTLQDVVGNTYAYSNAQLIVPNH